jgi:hypothetical protein
MFRLVPLPGNVDIVIREHLYGCVWMIPKLVSQTCDEEGRHTCSRL